MSPEYSKGLPIGTHIPPFSLPGVDGVSYTQDSFSDAEVLVVIFSCNHCPYVIAMEDRMIALQHEFSGRAQLVLINSNDDRKYPEDSFSNMVARAKEKQYPFPYLRDESQEVARAYDAACTPDPFVFDRARTLRYNGRIDDNWKEPENVRCQDLRTVIKELLAGNEITVEPMPSMGCSIKWK